MSIILKILFGDNDITNIRVSFTGSPYLIPDFILPGIGLFRDSCCIPILGRLRIAYFCHGIVYSSFRNRIGFNKSLRSAVIGKSLNCPDYRDRSRLDHHCHGISCFNRLFFLYPDIISSGSQSYNFSTGAGESLAKGCIL